MLVKESSPLLAVDALIAGYGKKQVLNGVNLTISAGEVVALIGHNGAGKSTLLKAVFGILPIWQGDVCLDGLRIAIPNPRNLLRAGVAFVIQGNRVFPDLTVGENLEIGGIVLADQVRVRAGIGYALELFPELEAEWGRAAGDLSGGQRQMLSLACALVTSPRLLLLDEPSLGLAQPLIRKTLQYIRDISRQSGTAFLIVEQKVREVLNVADRVYVLRNGRVSFSGLAESLKDDARLREAYL